MRVLALEPYFGGSHRAFIEGWSARSCHEWMVLGLPAYKWKWRMRHSAVTFAQQVAEHVANGAAWDVLFCSDMLNLAEFVGLSGSAVQALPRVAYFHENQLTYPVRHASERDYQFGMTNITTGLSADQVWFNSAFHRDSFLEAVAAFLKRMPDYQPFDAVERIRANSSIQPQGVADFAPREARLPGPLRILWAARWEHDKNPEAFFAALEKLQDQGVDFRVSVIGEHFRAYPPVFDTAQARFRANADRWGYQETRADYEAALREADVVVSTADHEFFGISVVEAIAAGAYPVLPRRLAYPEILSTSEYARASEFFYDGSVGGLTQRLVQLAGRLQDDDPWQGAAEEVRRLVGRFSWSQLAPVLDHALGAVLLNR